MILRWTLELLEAPGVRTTTKRAVIAVMMTAVSVGPAAVQVMEEAAVSGTVAIQMIKTKIAILDGVAAKFYSLKQKKNAPL